MRIGVDCFHLGPDIGGLKQYFMALFRELLRHDGENSYVFFTYPQNAGELSQLGVDTWQEHAILLHDRDAARRHLDRVDVYFSPFGVLWPRPLPKASVVMLPDIQEVRYPEFFAPLDRFNREWHFRGSTRLADAVITLSAYSKETLVRYYRLSPEKIFVTHVAVDDRYSRAAEVARPPQRPVPESFIFYPANRWRHKNHDGLLRALAVLRRRHHLPIHAVFTGYDVSNGCQLQEAANDHGVGDLVHDMGFLAVEELAFLYRQARLLVFPSLYEGFGIPLVEAMTAGCPVVASSHTSVPETAGDAALCFDPTSPEDMARVIEKAWCDTDLRRHLVEAGKRRSLSFSAAKMAEVHALAFRHAIEAYTPWRYPWNHVQDSYYRTRARARWS